MVMQEETESSNLLSVKEACDLTGMKQAKLLRKIRRGEIEAEKVGWVWIIKRKALEPFLPKE